MSRIRRVTNPCHVLASVRACQLFGVLVFDRISNGGIRTMTLQPDTTLDRDTAMEWKSGRERDLYDLNKLTVKIYADGADAQTMRELYADPRIHGFTTNPTLMRKARVNDYRAFALEILKLIPDRPISFEVVADDPEQMEEQALEIASWGKNVVVKVPITNTRGQFLGELLERLAAADVRMNVTALLTLSQVRQVVEHLGGGPEGKISVFAGRIADTGRDPVPVMAAALELLRPYPNLELIWASPRELFNVFQANAIGCHIITATTDILRKMELVGKDLTEYSLETVRMFYDDARKSGYELSRNDKDKPSNRAKLAR